MQKVKLPLTTDPIKDAQRRIDLNGIYTRQNLERLAESVNQVLSDAQVTISFFVDPQKLPVFKGTAQIEIELICQRCGEAYVEQLKTEFLYSPIKSIAIIDELPEIYEPIEVNAFGEIDLLALVEDELILSLPLVPKHLSEHCEVSISEQIFGELPIEEAKKPNPFAVLANLKK